MAEKCHGTKHRTCSGRYGKSVGENERTIYNIHNIAQGVLQLQRL